MHDARCGTLAMIASRALALAIALLIATGAAESGSTSERSRRTGLRAPATAAAPPRIPQAPAVPAQAPSRPALGQYDDPRFERGM